MSEMSLNLIPPHRIIDVTLWKPPDGVNMLRHQANCHRFKGMLQLHIYPGVAQYLPADWGCEDWFAVECHQGEEIGSTGLSEPAIVGQRVCAPGVVMCIYDYFPVKSQLYARHEGCARHLKNKGQASEHILLLLLFFNIAFNSI